MNYGTNPKLHLLPEDPKKPKPKRKPRARTTDKAIHEADTK